MKPVFYTPYTSADSSCVNLESLLPPSKPGRNGAARRVLLLATPYDDLGRPQGASRTDTYISAMAAYGKINPANIHVMRPTAEGNFTIADREIPRGLLRAILRLYKGCMITGSRSNPLYDGDPEIIKGPHEPHLDAMAQEITDYALANPDFVLAGVCGGAQRINKSMGGGLSPVDDAVHGTQRGTQNRYGIGHPVFVRPCSPLGGRKILHAKRSRVRKFRQAAQLVIKIKQKINSVHRYGFRLSELAPCLVPDVFSEEREPVVEAAHHPKKPILLAQWHPERLARANGHFISARFFVIFGAMVLGKPFHYRLCRVKAWRPQACRRPGLQNAAL